MQEVCAPGAHFFGELEIVLVEMECTAERGAIIAGYEIADVLDPVFEGRVVSISVGAVFAIAGTADFAEAAIVGRRSILDGVIIHFFCRPGQGFDRDAVLLEGVVALVAAPAHLDRNVHLLVLPVLRVFLNGFQQQAGGTDILALAVEYALHVYRRRKLVILDKILVRSGECIYKEAIVILGREFSRDFWLRFGFGFHGFGLAGTGAQRNDNTNEKRKQHFLHSYIDFPVKTPSKSIKSDDLSAIRKTKGRVKLK